MDKKIEDFSTVELKAFAYDALAQIQALQSQLGAINQEIAKRSQTATEPQKEIVESGKSE